MDLDFTALIVVLIGCATLAINSLTKRSIKKIFDDYEFSGVMEKLRIQTKLNEEIKAAISHDAWTVKEYLTLKRNKLEDLSKQINSLPTYITEINISVIKMEPLSALLANMPLGTLRVTQNLYFPELEDDVHDIYTQVQSFLDKSIDLKDEFVQSQMSLKQRQAKSGGLDADFENICTMVNALNLKCRSIMQELIKPKN